MSILREEIAKTGMSEYEFSKKVHVSQADLSRWINGKSGTKNGISGRNLMKIIGGLRRHTQSFDISGVIKELTGYE